MVEFALGITGHNPTPATRAMPGTRAGSPAGRPAAEPPPSPRGWCPATLGSDTGGSIRMPASLCDLFGIKPTYGRVSRYGCMPLSFSLDHVGPLARSAEDCALVLRRSRVTTRTTPPPAGARWRTMRRARARLAGLRVARLAVGRVRQDGSEMQRLADEAMAVLGGLGPRWASGAAEHRTAQRAAAGPDAGEGGAIHERHAHGIDDYNPQTAAADGAGPRLPASDMSRRWARGPISSASAPPCSPRRPLALPTSPSPTPGSRRPTPAAMRTSSSSPTGSAASSGPSTIWAAGDQRARRLRRERHAGRPSSSSADRSAEGLLLRAAHSFERETGIAAPAGPVLMAAGCARHWVLPASARMRGILLTVIAMLPVQLHGRHQQVPGLATIRHRWSSGCAMWWRSLSRS